MTDSLVSILLDAIFNQDKKHCQYLRFGFNIRATTLQ
jgi:hypothetical protein